MHLFFSQTVTTSKKDTTNEIEKLEVNENTASELLEDGDIGKNGLFV